MTASAQHATLGRGLFDTDGGRHRDVVLRTPDGWHEAALAEVAGGPPAHAARHELLGSVVDRLGAYAEPDGELIGALSRGDLLALALAVRRALLGSRLSLVLQCPNPGCGELADVDIDTDELLPDTSDPEPEWLHADTPGGRIELRSPTGHDDAAVAAAGGDPDARTALLMSRLVRAVDGEPLSPQRWTDLPAATRHPVLLALAEQHVAPTLRLDVSCPACRARMDVELDPLALLGRELSAGGGRIFAEVHSLAFHYGWSESEILALPRARRWRYLELLRSQVTGAPLLSTHGAAHV